MHLAQRFRKNGDTSQNVPGTNKSEVPLTEVRVAIVAIAHLRIRDGVSRAISTICDYFEQRVPVITDSYDREASHPISPLTRIYELGTAQRGGSFLLVGFVRVLSRSMKIRTIVNACGIRILSAHGYESLICCCVAKILSFGRIKVSWLVYDKEEFSRTGPLLSKLVNRMGLVDQVIVLGTGTKTMFMKSSPSSSVSVLRLGVSRVLTNLSATRSSRNNHPTNVPFNLTLEHSDVRLKLYFHGILVPRRRLEDLIQAIAILRENPGRRGVILYIAGDLAFDRAYSRTLTELVGRLQLTGDVVFLGPLNNDKAIALMYDYCDVFVFPCDQSWGLAPLEAMLFGKPVIVSQSAGVSEVLTEENLALVVPPGKPEILAGLIMDLINNDHLRQEMGVRGRRFVRENLTYVSTGQQLERLWSSLSNHSQIE